MSIANFEPPKVSASENNNISLKLRRGRSIVIVSVETTQSIETVKDELILALKDTSSLGLKGKNTTTSNGDGNVILPSHITFYKPKDPLNLLKGWERLGGEDEYSNGLKEEEKENKSKSNKSKITPTLTDLGLKEWSVLAYTLDQDSTKPESVNIEFPTDDEGE